MLRLLLDENLRAESFWSAIQTAAAIVPLDIVRVGDDDGPALGIGDGPLLDWAAAERRILVSFDKRTLPTFARHCGVRRAYAGGRVSVLATHPFRDG